MLKVRKHVGDMFFLDFQSTQSLGEFTGEEGDLFDGVYKGDDPKASTRPPLLGGTLGRDGAHPYVETHAHTLVPLHLTPIHSRFTPLHLTSLHSTSHHLTPSPLYSMRHSLITCASPHALAHSLMGIVTRIVINRR